MGKSAPSPPPAPDPNVVGNAQSTANVNTATAQALLNNTNQVTPFGDLTFDQTGSTDVNGQAVPSFTATTTLTPDEQAALDSRQQLTKGLYGLANDQLGRISSNISTPFALPGDAPAANADVLKRAQDAIYGQATARLDPQFATQEEQLDAKLRNQGFTPGTTGYDNAMRDFNFAKTDAYQQARDASVTGGQQAESQQYGLESQAYQTAIQNALLQRELPLNEASALEGGGQIQGPSLVSTPQTGVSPTDTTGAFGLQQSSLNNAFNAKANAASAGNNAEASAASAALMAAILLA